MESSSERSKADAELPQECLVKEYRIDASKAIEFKLIKSDNDLENNDIIFNPIFTHQIFGDRSVHFEIVMMRFSSIEQLRSETIFGYKNLKIKYYVTCGSLNTFITVDYKDKLELAFLKPNNILQVLSEYIKHDYTTNIDVFSSKIIEDYQFKPAGTLIKKYALKDEFKVKDRSFEIYKSTIFNTGFKEYYKRVQTFILFFIDAASYIDIDDDKWNFYLIYEKLCDNKYCIVGYSTLYNYYAYFDMIRPRLSQILILPPYQRNGHCTYLLQSIYDDLLQCSNKIVDFTVECPSNNFVKVRDFVDVKNFLNLDFFKSDDYRIISNRFYNNIKPKINQALKLSKKQSRRVYEIVCLKYLNENDKQELKHYKLEIKKRLKRNYLPKVKAAKGSLTQNVSELLSNMQKMNKYLNTEANNLISLYREVLDRIDYERNNNNLS